MGIQLLFFLWFIIMLVTYGAVIRFCLLFDNIRKSNYIDEKMYKYRKWMPVILVFRSCEDSSGDAYRLKHKMLDKRNMDHVSKLAFWLQITNTVMVICIIVTVGAYINNLDTLLYIRLLKITWIIYFGYFVIFMVIQSAIAIPIEKKLDKKLKEKEDRMYEKVTQQYVREKANTDKQSEIYIADVDQKEIS